MILDLTGGKLCLECDRDLDEGIHISAFYKCHKCEYKTCCLRAMLEHTSACPSSLNADTGAYIRLEREMHCVCGFSSSEGNSLARHLALCDHKSAYPTVEAAQENTVKRNMLDMLGLVRREGDEGGENEITTTTTDNADTVATTAATDNVDTDAVAAPADGEDGVDDDGERDGGMETLQNTSTADDASEAVDGDVDGDETMAELQEQPEQEQPEQEQPEQEQEQEQEQEHDQDQEDDEQQEQQTEGYDEELNGGEEQEQEHDQYQDQDQEQDQEMEQEHEGEADESADQELIQQQLQESISGEVYDLQIMQE